MGADHLRVLTEPLDGGQLCTLYFVLSRLLQNTVYYDCVQLLVCVLFFRLTVMEIVSGIKILLI